MEKDDLKLPIGEFPEQDRWLSMDDYIEFVNFCANNFPKDKVSAEEAFVHVRVPFSI